MSAILTILFVFVIYVLGAITMSLVLSIGRKRIERKKKLEIANASRDRISNEKVIAYTEHQNGVVNHRAACTQCLIDGQKYVREYLDKRAHECPDCLDATRKRNERTSIMMRYEIAHCPFHDRVYLRLHNMMDWWLKQDDLDVKLMQLDGWKVK